MASKVPIFIVDAFTAKPFGGNPAAVCIFEEMPSDYKLQQIASEMNLSETAFIVPSKTSTTDLFQLRWFTPTLEVRLCGHATLAAAHVLFSNQHLQELPKIHSDLLKFETLSGILSVQRLSGGKLRMDFPQGKPFRTALSEETIRALQISLPIKDREDLLDVWYCPQTRKLIVEVSSPAIVEGLFPTFSSLVNIEFGTLDVKGIAVTSRGNGSTKYQEYDFVSRYFAPWLGIPEDPVTGSAHTTLAVFWSNKLQKSHFRAFQASARGGEMDISLPEEGRVLLEGSAVSVLAGQLNL